MTDQHPDERPADGAAAPPEPAGGGRRVGRPPVDEGATVPLTGTGRAGAEPDREEPDHEEPDREEPASATTPASGQPPADEVSTVAVLPPAVRPVAGPVEEEPLVVAPGPDTWGHEDDEDTAPLTPPTTAPAVDDEPTVEHPKRVLRAPEDRISARDRAGNARAGDDGAGEDAAGESGVSPDVVTTGDDERVAPAGGVPGTDWPFKKFVSAGVLIWVLLALFGFTLVVQLRSNNSDEGLASARQDDLVRILSDLEARDTRLQAEIAALETSQRQLTSGVAGRQAALAEAEKRADELGLLAGTLPGRGRGLAIEIDGVRASAVLNAVQELRGAGGEVMQLSGSGGGAVRIVASTYFVDAEGGGIVADGKTLTGPYQLLVIGVPQTMQTALEIPGGVVASVKSNGGSVTMEQRNSVDVTALREATSLQYARPVS